MSPCRTVGHAALSRRSLLAATPVMPLFTATPATTRPSTPVAGTPATGAWTFTDDRGRSVSLQDRPERVVAQVSAAAALWDYGLRPVGIFGPHRLADGSQDPQSGNVDLDEVEAVGGEWGEFDLEAFIALDPDLLVSQLYGTDVLWYVPEDVQPLIEAEVSTIGIVVQEMPITRPLARFEELAAALGADLQSLENVTAKDEFLAAEDDLRAAIAENPGLRVLVVAGGPEALYVANAEKMVDLIYFRELGLDIVQIDTDEWWDALSWEQVNKYPADLVLSDARSQSYTAGQLAEIETWQALPAVAAGQVAAWHSEPSFSYRSYAPVLRELADAIRNARADIIP